MEIGGEFVEFDRVTFSYDGRKDVFSSLTFSLPKERIGIMGPNGCGKSTLLQMVVGLLKPKGGRVVVLGKERVAEEDFYEVRKRVGLVFQDPDDQLFCPTVEEDLAFGPLNLGWDRKRIEEKVREVLGFLGLNGFERRVTYKLSGGEKRLVAIGTVLTMEPEVLLLDEPTGDLSPENVERLVDVLKRFDGYYIVVSHDRGFLDLVTDRVLWFDGRGFEEI